MDMLVRRSIVEYHCDYLERKGGVYRGHDWEKFRQDQQELLNQRANDGWELLQVVPLIGQESLGAAAASRTAGMLYYFERE